jgi:hypothetical protein
MKGRKTIQAVDGQTLVYCNYHKDYSPNEDFGRVSHTNKPRPRCRKCEALISRNNTAKRRELREAITDEEATKQLLEALGYKTDDQEPVWMQFMRKYNIF